MSALEIGALSIVFVLLGVGVCALGAAGRRGRIDFSWGGHTRENTSPQAWRAAHVVAGQWMILTGLVYLAIGLAVLAASGSTVVVGWIVGVGLALSMVFLAAMIAGAMRVLGRDGSAEPGPG